MSSTPESQDYYSHLDQAIRKITDDYGINNLNAIERRNGENGYWERFAKLSFFKKLFDEHRYHFLYEIQGLSSQIHFGIVNSILFREKISKVRGRPNLYNHRYTFMIESTIHGIYAYWNRVGLALNTYLKSPLELKRTYFSTVVKQLLMDYPDLRDNGLYQWLSTINDSLNNLERNEFAHNNSLIMQNFLPKASEEMSLDKLMEMPELLLSHNESIVDEVYNLVGLMELLEEKVKNIN